MKLETIWQTQKVEDVTASRSFGVSYTNNTGKTLFVMVTVSTVIAAVGDQAQAIAQVNGVNTAATGVSTSVGVSPIGLFRGTLTLILKPKDVYNVNAQPGGTGVVILSTWVESW